METWQLGLTIHGRHYNYKDLLAFSSNQMVSSDTNPWEKELYRFIITWLSDSDHILQFSSGTTGKPKEIRLPKTSMMTSAENTCRILDIRERNTALLCMPVEYIAGKMMVVRSFVCRLNLLTTEPKSLPNIMADPSVDFCAMVPLQVLNLLNCRSDLHPIKKLIIGGADISHELEKLVQSISTEAYASYGMAETCSHVALRRMNGNRPQKYYAALPEINLSSDERGCLEIEAPYLPTRVVTNDIVEFIAPGTFKWLGRYDNLINSGGVKIVPEVVESIIMEKTRLECVAMSAPDPRLGHKLVLVVEKDRISSSLESLKSELANFLPRRWKPREIFIVNKFPRNDSMKIDRRKLSGMI